MSSEGAGADGGVKSDGGATPASSSSGPARPAVATPDPAVRPAPRLASFVAIDFETADYGADSACAIGLVKVVENRITERAKHLIRPPRRPPYNWFPNTRIHRITWSMVADAPGFAELWPELAGFMEGAPLLVAHNARFDRGVLHACCRASGIAPPPQDFACTVELARAAWDLRPTRLPDCCRYLGIRLDHHDPLSDALACARIAIAAAEDGVWG